MNKQKLIDLVERAAWTFAQTFVVVWAASNFSLSKVAIVGAAASGLSAVKTFIKETL